MNISPNSLWFYSKGGEQKGPVSFSDLQQLLAEGLSPSTLVWTEGEGSWVPASRIPELIPQTISDPSNPYSAPTTNVALEPTMAASGREEPPEPPIPLDIGFCIGQGWKHTFANFGTIFLVGLIYLAITFGVWIVTGLIFGGQADLQMNERDFQTNPGSPLSFIGGLINQCVSLFLNLGITHIGLRILRGEHPQVGEIFSQGNKFLNGALATFLFAIMVVLGFICLIIPGIFMVLRFGFFMEAIVEKNLDAISALKYSYRLTRENTLSRLGLAIISILIVFAGVIALGVGLIIAIPVVWMTSLVAYRYLHAGTNGLKVLP